MFDHLPVYVDDPILGLFERYKADPRPFKTNLGIGIYCDEDGRVPVLESVRRARRSLLEADAPSLYAPTEGDEAYRSAVRELVFGASSPPDITVVQTVAGTGALKVGAEFLRHVLPKASVWLPDPTWANHSAIFASSGFELHTYPYHDAATGGFALDGALAELDHMPAGSVVLLHPCCHNPTGIDPSRHEWDAMLKVIERRGLLPFFDMAYQGFADGIDEDAWAIRECVRRGIGCLVASSFSKIFSLYGDRVGALSVYAPSSDASRILGRLKTTIRSAYSCPPAPGAALVQAILDDAELKTLWSKELGAMRHRMNGMRSGLHAMLKAALPSQDHDYLTRQKGMFSYSRLSPHQIDELREKHGVYIVSSGRLCVAGLNLANLAHVCESFVAINRSCES